MSTWRKASYSMSDGHCAEIGSYRTASASHANGNCTEIGSYRKSAACQAGECIEAGQGEQVIGVRDTKEKHLGDARTVLEFSTGAWNRFLTQIRKSESQ